MDSDSEFENLLEAVDPNDSDYEYLPSGSEEDSEDDAPQTKRKKLVKAGPGHAPDETPQPKRTKLVKAGPSHAPDNVTDTEEDDNIPLAVLREKIIMSRSEMAAAADDEILDPCVFTEPMWNEMSFSRVDTTFKGRTEETPDTLKTPYQFLKDLITDEMLETVQKFTNDYALKKSGIELKTSKKEIEVFIGIYLRMGLMKAHCVRAFWGIDTRYPPVADEMSRNRFELIMRHLHFCDNDDKSLSDEDKSKDRLWKIRRWIQSLRQNLKANIPLQHQSIDEIMVAFKGRSVVKQYIRSKPHRWGFKMWARTGSDGVLHDFDVYQGSSQRKEKTAVGLSGQVVLDMSKDLDNNVNHIVYADSLSNVYCLKCGLHLCINKDRNCFLDHHTK